MIRRLPALALVAFAGIYLWLALAIPLDPWSATEAINARTLPLAYGVALLIVAAALLFQATGAPSKPPPASGDGQTPDGERAAMRRRWQNLTAQCVIIAAFGLVIPIVGPWLALAALLLASLWAAGERRLPILLLLPACTAGAAWLVVAVLLDVYLDPGSLFSNAMR